MTGKSLDEYDLSQRKVLCNDVKMIAPPPVDPKPDPSSAVDYFPLLLYPIQIINVVIDPLVVLIGPVRSLPSHGFHIFIIPLPDGAQ